MDNMRRNVWDGLHIAFAGIVGVLVACMIWGMP